MSKSRKSKFDSYKDMYIDITEPSFQALGFDILEMEITNETILEAFVIAAFSGNYIMVERIKTYLIENKYLYGQIEADVRDYILDNAISIGKYLNTQEEMVCDGDGKVE